MTYGDAMLIFLGVKPIPKDLDPRIGKITMHDCLAHKPNDEIIFDEGVTDNDN